jgi:hypothetical protein
MTQMHLRQLEHRLAIVAETLRQEFPDDFYKRCSYATFGTLALLREAGERAWAVGGESVAFILSKDAKTPSIKGFASDGQRFSHFWVETADRLIDVSTHFLPDDATLPTTPMPAVAWEKSSELPRYLRYKELAVIPEGQEMGGQSIVSQRGKIFVDRCMARLANQTEWMKFPTWVVTGRPSVSIAAKRGNLWAIGAEKFDGWVNPTSLPF